MVQNYFKIAWRNLLEQKGYSLLNIGGLATGMAIVILIGLWMYDELSYDMYFKNYDHIAQVMHHNNSNGQKNTVQDTPPVLAEAIRNSYGSDFKYVLQASFTEDFLLEFDNKKIRATGKYFEPEVTEMLSLQMIKGTRKGLMNPYSILLSESTAVMYFGNTDPIGKTMRFDNRWNIEVTGVYKDLPKNTSFSDLKVILPWQLFYQNHGWIQTTDNLWGGYFTLTYAQIADGANMGMVSERIKKVIYDNVNEGAKNSKPEVFLHPMKNWHLRSEFENGINTGGRIQYISLFGVIGFFILLLACINFMNLSTAQSEKRAMEVGVRKALGSIRKQLIEQFLTESIVIAMLALVVSLVIAQLCLPFFNEIADKELRILWLNPLFWGLLIVFAVLTGVLAGFYPAFFLSAFKTVEVLKGTLSIGSNAFVPRKILVVVQFTISIILIIGTLIVYSQIRFGKDRSVGYSRDGLITINATSEIQKHFESIRNELKSSGTIVEITQSSSPTTDVWLMSRGLDWRGKDPNLVVALPINGVTYEYGKTVNWELIQGRDFSRDFATDSTNAAIINETAAKFMGLKNPIGEVIRWGGQQKQYTIIGVIKDMIVESPFEPIRPVVFKIDKSANVVILKLAINQNIRSTLTQVEQIFRKYNPNYPFEYRFVDQDYALKFGSEERVGKLASGFSGMAIIISCLGLFGLASFVAQRRTKEIGIRKVLGASVPRLWGLLSKEFVSLVILSCLIAIPLAWYFMNDWLQNYTYRTTISFWIFASTILGVFLITVASTSYQAIKAARANPIKSLRTE
ncbi:MAG: ABC transporter permease [Bacteroidota bacterium]